VQSVDQAKKQCQLSFGQQEKGQRICRKKFPHHLDQVQIMQDIQIKRKDQAENLCRLQLGRKDMNDTTNHRLDRIEEKLDKLATAMVSIARAEEKIASMQDFQHNQIERVNRLSVKLDDIEKKVDDNHRTVCLINKLVYAAIIAAVGAYVAQWI